MTKNIEQIEISTVCPTCNKSISEIWIARLDSVIGIRYAYICGECKNLLKISKGKNIQIYQVTRLFYFLRQLHLQNRLN